MWFSFIARNLLSNKRILWEFVFIDSIWNHNCYCSAPYLFGTHFGSNSEDWLCNLRNLQWAWTFWIIKGNENYKNLPRNHRNWHNADVFYFKYVRSKFRSTEKYSKPQIKQEACLHVNFTKFDISSTLNFHIFRVNFHNLINERFIVSYLLSVQNRGIESILQSKVRNISSPNLKYHYMYWNQNTLHSCNSSETFSFDGIF